MVTFQLIAIYNSGQFKNMERNGEPLNLVLNALSTYCVTEIINGNQCVCAILSVGWCI